MPLHLIVGPANSAKAGEVLGAYAAAVPRGAVLVVPTAADASVYGRELAEQGTVLGSVLTFSGLAAEIARRAGYSARPLSALQRSRVLARVARRSSLRAADTPGFAAAAGVLIGELERSLVTPQRFLTAMRAWAAQDERRAGYAEAVAALYGDYARELERLRRVDGDLYAWRALDALRAAPGAWGSGPVFLYGFDDLHPLQRDAVETLAGVVGVEVTVSLTYEAGRTALAARAETVQELAPLGTRVVELPALERYYEPNSRAALHHLERSLFEPQPEAIDPGPAVRLLEAGGARAEAELVAAEVLGLLQAGVLSEEIAVVYRSLGGVAPLVERQFRRYGIAVAGRGEVPVRHTPLGRGLLALARCALLGQRASADDLLAYVRSPGVVDQRAVADRLEAEIRRRGLRSAEQARERLPLPLPELAALAAAADPAAVLIEVGRRRLAAAAPDGAPVLDEAQALDARALAAIAGAAGELAELGETLSGPELIELLEELTVTAGSASEPTSGAVLLTEPLPIRARRFRAVFVCGLQEGVFPLPAAPEPFLSDEHRRELAAGSGLRLRLRPSEAALADERYLFYSCVSRATEQVVLSFRSSDEEGNLALASPFVADVADLFVDEWAERRRTRLLADVVWSEAEAPSQRELARTRAAAAPATGDAAAPPASLSDVALRHVRHRETLSGSALEAYADCPVRWLVERELQPARFEPDPEPLARGSYMHDALEEVLRRLGSAVTPDRLPEAFSILSDVLRELPPTVAPGRPPGVRAAALRMIEADLRRYLEHEARDGCTWQPRALELRFGFEDEEGSLPALELAGPVRLRGAIDRVDVDPDGARAIVRDYKSGSTRPEYQGTRWRTDRRLQVALYMLAVRRLLGLEPVAGVYQPLGGGDLRARGVFLKGATPGDCLFGNDGRDESELEEELAAAEAAAAELAARLREGELTPCPETCSRDGCRYPAICRVT